MTPRSERAGPALILAGLAALAPLPALGHAALLEAEATAAIRLQARYDTGAPMAGAQVLVYAPDAPTRAWGQGTTDAAGGYLFAPDPALPGRWTVQVRQAGHGAVAHVELGATDTAGAAVTVIGGGEATPSLQRLVMVALVVWGALGTALWVRGRRAARASA